MIRNVIKIDESLCNGCEMCVTACHEGAIAMVDGKAKLIRDDYCDGLGDCLPACPTGAITFEEREAAAYDEDAVQAHLAARQNRTATADFAVPESPAPTGCPGSQARSFVAPSTGVATPAGVAPGVAPMVLPSVGTASQLRHWPVQVQLISPSAQFLDGADVLLAADCTAYAYGDFHNRFMKDRAVLIACPKLDRNDWVDKFAFIVSQSNIRSLTVVRMQVPCCGGIVAAAQEALSRSGKDIPLTVVTLSAEGQIIEEERR